MSRFSFLSMLVLSLFGGCSTTALPPLGANNPASADAREAVTPPARPLLGIDRATQRTNQLIAAHAEQESQGQSQRQPEQNFQNMPGMQSRPGMKHDKEGDHEDR